MLIEYNITFEKDGLTIKQRVDTSASGSQGKVVGAVAENSLKSSFQKSKATNTSVPLAGGGPGDVPGSGGGPGDVPGSGGGGPVGTAPITIIGPFIMCCPSSDSKKEGKG
ncbi:MAG: hypothetical protein M3Y72_22185 [Acidobacteriota bacterium]|nr:hypothetical protein [Acidobacteriota bacterium]